VPYDNTNLNRVEGVKIDYTPQSSLNIAGNRDSRGRSPHRSRGDDRKESGNWRLLVVDTSVNPGGAMRGRRNSDMGDRKKSTSPARVSDGGMSARGDRPVTPQAQRLSLEDAEPAARYGLDIAVESCMPFLMLEAYLNMAELRMLQGENFQAISFWWEVSSRIVDFRNVIGSTKLGIVTILS